MRITPTYRHKIALLLLMLYAFIATPVQLWHHHHCSGTHVAKHSTVIKKASHAALDAGNDCSICAHKYAVYSDDVATAPPIVRTAHAYRYCITNTTAVYITTQAFTNKGPPAA